MPPRPVAALAFVAALVAAPIPAIAAEAAASRQGKALAAFFEREFRRDLEEGPEYATILGIPGMGDGVTAFGAAAVMRRRARTARSLAALRAFDPAKLTTQERISREMMMDDLAQGLAMNRIYGDLPFGSGWSDGPFPVTSMWGPQQSLPGIARGTAFRTIADYENYLARLGKGPAALEQIAARLRAGLASGWVPPREAMQAVPGQFATLAGGDIAATPLCPPCAPRSLFSPGRSRPPIASAWPRRDAASSPARSIRPSRP